MVVVGGFLIMAFVLYMLVFVRMYRELLKEKAEKKEKESESEESGK